MDLQTLVDSLWIVCAAALVLLMQIGFCALEAGLVRSKNSINVAAKNLIDLCVTGVAFWAVGAWIMFGDGKLVDIGFDDGADSAWVAAFMVFQIMFCGTASTIVSGAVAERVRFLAYVAIVLVTALVVYPVVGRLAWQGIDGGTAGWLEAQGFIDFAGSTVVHSVGGWIALAALLVIGPRADRYQDGGTRPQSSNVAMAAIGVGLIWVGWIGFNGGSTLAADQRIGGIVLNTILAACAGGCASQVVGRLFAPTFDVHTLLNGILGGLVAITAGCAVMSPGAAVAVGAVGGGVVWAGMWLLDRVRIDDAVGAVPVHLFAGIWGTLAVAVFARAEDLTMPMLDQLAVQFLGVVTIGAFAFVTSWILLRLIHAVTPLRASHADERAGLNIAEHGATSALTDLVQAMETHRRTGALDRSVAVEPGSEIEPIADQYNRVLAKIRWDTNQLQRAHTEIVRAKAEAEAANLAKSTFLASMSHELRTPLNAVIGFSEILVRESFGPVGGNGRYKSYAEDILEAGSHLLALVNDLLEHSRIESGKVDLEDVEVDLAAAIFAVSRLTQDIAERAGVAVSHEIEDAIPPLRCDRRMLRQILLNLLSNALKFTEAGGRVVVSARLESDGRIAIVVSDTGIGMSRAGIRQALDPFNQVSEHYKHEHTGAGLGLSLVRTMLRLHSGTMVIDSIVGHGTTVTCRFPHERTVLPESAAGPARQETNDDVEDYLGPSEPDAAEGRA